MNAVHLRQTLAKNLTSGFKGVVGRLAQLEEHLVYTERVGGSSPSAPTISHSNGGFTQLLAYK
jgi:hypothetical protein